MMSLPDWNDLPEDVRTTLSSLPSEQLTGHMVYTQLRAALGNASSAGLQWETAGDEHIAESSVGRFDILPIDGVHMVFLDSFGVGGRYDTVAAAKVAAQSEYRRRDVLRSIADRPVAKPPVAAGYASDEDLNRIARETDADKPFVAVQLHRHPSGKANVALYVTPLGLGEGCIQSALDETYTVEDDPDESDHDQQIRIRTARRIAANLKALLSSGVTVPDLTDAQRATLREMRSYAPNPYFFRHATCAELVRLGLAAVVQPATGRQLKRPPHRITELGLAAIERGAK